MWILTARSLRGAYGEDFMVFVMTITVGPSDRGQNMREVKGASPAVARARLNPVLTPSARRHACEFQLKLHNIVQLNG